MDNAIFSPTAGQVEPVNFEGRAVNAQEVAVTVTHCSIGSGDVAYIDRLFEESPSGLYAGHEIIGLVEQVGSDVANVRPGDRVGLGYQVASCRTCRWCMCKMPQFCADQRCLVSDEPGGFAGQVIANSEFVVPINNNVESAIATPIMCAGVTAFNGITRSNLQDGMRVAVVGIGGLGHLAVRFLDAMGHNVTAITTHPERRDALFELGATAVKTIDQATSHEFERMFITTPATTTLDAALETLTPDGIATFLASPAERINVEIGLLNFKCERSIRGGYIGSPQDIADTLAFCVDKNVWPVVEMLPWSEAESAIAKVRSQSVQWRMVIER